MITGHSNKDYFAFVSIQFCCVETDILQAHLNCRGNNSKMFYITVSAVVLYYVETEVLPKHFEIHIQIIEDLLMRNPPEPYCAVSWLSSHATSLEDVHASAPQFRY